MSAQTPATHERQAVSMFRREIVGPALFDSVKKLDPRVQIHNPVMFVVEIGSVITTVTWLIQVFGGKPLGGGHEEAWYTFTISFWLWLTVAKIPVDAVNTSASGVDPEISSANARIQAYRIAAVRGLSLAAVDRLISSYTDARGLGFSGEPGVNVLELNLALDRLTKAGA